MARVTLSLVLNEMREGFGGLAKRIDQVEAKSDARFEFIKQEFQNVNRRLDGVETRLDRVESRLDRVDVRLDRMETKLDKITEINSRVSKLEHVSA
ncbi:MAG: hypothetical protein P4M08_06170 [Oligoflexia bacterium]|nr:hypothetical protein [Oligoflexia bacterium]